MIVLQKSEKKMLYLLWAGKKREEISQKMNISFSTYSLRLKKIRQKFGVENNTQCLVSAYRQGHLKMKKNKKG